MTTEKGRRAARRAAVVLLYQKDLTGQDLDAVRDNARRGDDAEAVDDPYVNELIEGVTAAASTLDARIDGAADGWSAARLGMVERAILRVAVWELTNPAAGVPQAVAINEAVDLTKRYCAAEAASFVNGVLGRIARGESEPD